MNSSLNTFSRRSFLKKSSLIACAVSLCPFSGCREDGKADSPKGRCSTTDDILGPFYKAGAPFVENIIPPGVMDLPLIVEGVVLSRCSDPVPDAVVEIWNANSEGEYDNSEDFHFRGRSRTASDGIYRFRTIIPGRYLNGSTYRPSHIHFRITAPGFADLVSQIYFREDPFIDTDPWASAEKARERILPVTKATDGTDIVNFDIHLTTNS